MEQPNPFGRIKDHLLVKFENDLGVKLPSQYRDWLIKYNGMGWEKEVFHITDKEGDSRIHHVYGLHDGPDSRRLDITYKVFKGRIDSHVFPIADDPFGNQVCLGISGNKRKKIYFWDHERELDVDDNPILISDSFNAFLESLQDEEYDDHLEEIISTGNIDGLKEGLESGLYSMEALDEYDRTIIERAAIAAQKGIIIFLYNSGANLRNSLHYAMENAEYFEDHKEIVKLIKRLEVSRPSVQR